MIKMGKTTGSYPKEVNSALPIPKLAMDVVTSAVNMSPSNQEQVMISGYLTRGHEEMKDKPFKKKHRKYYVLRYKEKESATIYEYKDDKDFTAPKPKHTVDKVPLLRSTKLHLFDHIEIHKHKYENILCVLMRKDMALYLQADSKEIATQWYKSLNSILTDMGHGADAEDLDNTIHRSNTVPTPVTTKFKRDGRKSSPAAMEDTFHPLKKKTIEVIDENAIPENRTKKDDDSDYLIPNVSQDESESSSNSTSQSSTQDPSSPDWKNNDAICKCCNRNHIQCEGPMPGYINIHQVSDFNKHQKQQLAHKEALCRERDQYMTLAEVSRKLQERAIQQGSEHIQTGYNPMKSPCLPQMSTSQCNISTAGGWPLMNSISMPSIPPPTPPRPKKLMQPQPQSDSEDDEPAQTRLRLRRSSSTSQLADINKFMEEAPSTPQHEIDVFPPSLPPRDFITSNGNKLMPELPIIRSKSPTSRTDTRRFEGLQTSEFNSSYARMGRGVAPPTSLALEHKSTTAHLLTIKSQSPLKMSPRSPTRHFFSESPPHSPKLDAFSNRRRLYDQDPSRKTSIPTPPPSPYAERRKISATQSIINNRQQAGSPTQSRKLNKLRTRGEVTAPVLGFSIDSQMSPVHRSDISTIDVTDRPLPPRPEGMDVEKIVRTMETVLWEKTKEDGIPIPILKSDLIDKLALVKFNDLVWIAGKRSTKERSTLDKLHIGDHLWRINDQIVVDPKTAQDMIRTSAKEEVTLYIKRLPHAKIVRVKRSSPTRDWGIKCVQNEVKAVSPSGPAFESGVTPKTNCVTNNRLCDWCITEINFNWFRLTGIGKDSINKKLAEISNLELTLILQPSDFIKELKTRIEKLPNAHVFTVSRS
ncbi:uncharacterized protein LOC117121343 isoform X2 [Anneissia japonica]|uniref:uncharacterized protein LOC117121343 isoform X2 n=1 Tax=Anneissia japonica TaxID=1529436 RepID=UPI0014256080|nr:uncharacterized protein LOC117121343 isoform X2 [Anneissia japonica]